MSWESIQHWLRHIDAPAKIDHSSSSSLGKSSARPPKRTALASPPMSTSSAAPAKRRRTTTNPTAGDDPDDDELEYTPRPVKSAVVGSAPKSVRSSASSQSTTSGQASPSKQLSSLRLLENGGVETRTLDIESRQLPTELYLLFQKMLPSFQTQRGLLHPSQRDEMRSHFVTGDRPSTLWNDDALYSESRAELGPSAPLAFVQDILHQAAECSDNWQSESSWSQMVYYPLLRHAMEDPSLSLSQEGRVLVVPCTTAPIIPAYRVHSRSSNMVDYAVAFEPPPNSGARESIDGLRRGAIEESINHTDFVPLRHRPIILSIEVKRLDGIDKAKLQLGMWMAAQWKKLDELSRDPPEFLLAIIISGHEWSIAASTRDQNKRVILWEKCEFGNTRTAINIYKIDFALRTLTRYAREEYWPWFKLNCLG